jgi:Fic family protein
MQTRTKWVWQHAQYCDFPYDHRAISGILSKTAYQTGVLEGAISLLDSDSSTSAQIDAATIEILASSEIEGEILSRDSVRDSVRKKLDKHFDHTRDRSTHHTDGLVDVLIDSSFNHAPLDAQRLHGWHSALFPTGYSGLYRINVATYRTETMQVVSGQGIRETVHYEAPPADRIDKEMERFFAYVNTSEDDPYVQSALAHLWFVIIHPYDDGNGRIARAIANHVLSKALGLNHNYFSISSAVMQGKKTYYTILERSNNLFYNRAYDFTPWVQWHTEMIGRAVDFSLERMRTIAQKTRFWDRARSLQLHRAQIKVLTKLLDAGKGNFQGDLTNKKYRSITGTTQITASRHLKDLVQKGLLEEVEGYGGRSTRYAIVFY